MYTKVQDKEYLFIKCSECDERVKLAKNKGSSWSSFNFLQDFLLEHSTCGKEAILLEWEA